MKNFNTYFAIKRILLIRREQFFQKISENFIFKLFFLGRYIMAHSVFFKSKSPGFVNSANLFMRILVSLCVVQKYAKKSVILVGKYAKGI
jgi:hypothetical protein